MDHSHHLITWDDICWWLWEGMTTLNGDNGCDGGLCPCHRHQYLLSFIKMMGRRDLGCGSQLSSPGAITIHDLWGYVNDPSVLQSVFTIAEKAPTRAFSWLKAPTSAFTFKTLLRHYAKRSLTPRSLNVKLGPRHKSHKVIIVSYSHPSLMIIASRTQFHVERPWGQRIVS